MTAHPPMTEDARVALIVLAALALAACKTDAPAKAPSLREKQHEENAMAGYMVRLGYDRFAAACGYAMALKHKPRAMLAKNCTVSFSFTGPITGEP
jgi:hypothetical protein